ncbi:hypothetical protein CHARACLAT_023080 [Characodon lateralis]|uniref:Uncharacterized protein n=1 Tax=Characodon lateralis TaxID=208331 RepID=A0ABU7F5A9_9TELE|nr:hypothetical protein [Characodon lateralis]
MTTFTLSTTLSYYSLNNQLYLLYVSSPIFLFIVATSGLVVLFSCAIFLAHVLTDIFNTLLTYAFVPSCFKTVIIIPVPKTATISSLQRLPPCRTHSCHGEVLRGAGEGAHHLQITPLQPLHTGCCFLHTPPEPGTSGEE